MKRKVRVRTYTVTRRAVEEGCAYASHRFSKYLDSHTKIEDLDREALADTFADAVMNEICEVINFDDDVEK